ncbi:MAG: Spo0B domain-containing protein [Sporomusaceae bacterium]|nr:Spo0B domain-containing protein [Sporomusaceae bacterium]
MDLTLPEGICPEIVRLLRAQRHDFVNHLQVAHALLQLGKADQAQAYLEKVAQDTNMVNETLRLHYKGDLCCKGEKE